MKTNKKTLDRELDKIQKKSFSLYFIKNSKILCKK